MGQVESWELGMEVVVESWGQGVGMDAGLVEFGIEVESWGERAGMDVGVEFVVGFESWGEVIGMDAGLAEFGVEVESWGKGTDTDVGMVGLQVEVGSWRGKR